MLTSRHRRTVVRAFTSALAMLLFANQIAFAQQTIGDTQVVVNDVRGIVGTNEPAVLRAGIDVFQNETIRTGEKSASRVLFQDNTTLSVGAGSEVKLDNFVFDPDPSKSKVALSVGKGVVRFVTGSLPKSSYSITTPVATIGVRGTIVTISVAADGTTTITVDEGSIVVTAGGQTVVVDAGMTTVVAPGAAALTPYQTPAAPPDPVSEMEYLLADNKVLPAGDAAGGSAGNFAGVPVIVWGAAGVIALVFLVTGGGDHKGSASTTHNSPATAH